MVILEDIPSTQPLPMKLPVSMLCYAWSDTCYLPTLCIEPKDVPLFPLLVTRSAFTTFCKFSWSFPWFCFNHLFQHSHHFLSVTFYLNHKLQVSSCSWNILLYIFFFKYSSFCFSSVHFFNLAFIALCNGFQSFAVLSSSSKIFFHWGSCCARLSSHYKT